MGYRTQKIILQQTQTLFSLQLSLQLMMQNSVLEHKSRLGGNLLDKIHLINTKAQDMTVLQSKQTDHLRLDSDRADQLCWPCEGAGLREYRCLP